MKLFSLYGTCLFLFLVVVCLVACKSPAGITSESTDSTHVEYKYRDVPVLVPGETITVTEYIECDSVTNKPKAKKFSAKGSKAKVNGSIDDKGNLNVTGGCDSLTAIVKAQDKEILRLKTKKTTITKPPRIEYKTHWFDIAARWISVFTILFILYKTKKLLPI